MLVIVVARKNSTKLLELVLYVEVYGVKPMGILVVSDLGNPAGFLATFPLLNSIFMYPLRVFCVTATTRDYVTLWNSRPCAPVKVTIVFHV